MFQCRTAWFSKSVNEAHLKFWVQEGGTITGWRKADFIFSEDATSSDTLRIFESKDFLWDKVTVFHSLFLLTCEKRQSVKSVCIGHYVLPPVPVQNEMRKAVGRLIWEGESDPSVTQENSVSSKCLDEESGEELSVSNCEPSDEDSSPEKENHLRNKANGTLTGQEPSSSVLDEQQLSHSTFTEAILFILLQIKGTSAWTACRNIQVN
ncbi:telomere repeats-binding bouquet formation protein 2 isoform X2 [Oryzias latipes]|uniref:telomere repeats-binding bouquet formation protein 2 isoform X2 n=1 Tax=Oryzias latipes TaxID=8090 RepID=UPI0002A4CB67|nr:telomere repeats-binding bouquet formation protein 2 isoform X2 [Oryzias latipes]